ncbi:hypothetical protein M758_5G048900 [Ceratodon purpureus]|nr:hypothetical protein M758_5G048900 [Ceratodon purpureus]
MAVLAAVLVVVLSLIATAFYSYVDRESPIDALALSFPGPFPKLEGVYASNTLLQNVEKLGTGKVLQPEDFVLDPTGKFLYVGTSDGWIKKVYLKDGAVEDWKRVGGRPLGLALGNDGEVIVCEPAQGLLKVTDDGVEVLATEAEGTKFRFTDAAAVGKDGLIYFTDASSKYELKDFMLDALEGRANGRIMVYNPADKSTKVLLKDLYFANGIALSKDEEFFIFAETSLARLLKYYLKGEKKGTTEVINDKLPGLPDNLHYNYDKGVLYVGILSQRDAILDLFWKTPYLKKLAALFPSILAATNGSPKTARVLVIDEDGNPLKMYQDPTGKAVGFVTAALEVDGYLYVGGLRDDFVGRIPV